jgi:large subunit ribosomal protein L23
MSRKDKTTRGPELAPHQIVLRPLITEKATHQASRYHAYPFEVNPWASKDEIKAAVEELFNVRVEKVRTQNRAGKRKRFRNGMGRLAHWKKAIVTLHEDSPQIDFF